MSKKHTLTRQPKSRTLPPEDPGLEERFEAVPVSGPDVDAVNGTNRVKIYALRQPQAREQHVPQVLVW